MLSSEEYGMYSVFITWLNIFTVFATLNLSSGPYYNGMLKYDTQRDRYTSSIQMLGSILSVSFAIVLWVAFPYIKLFIGLSRGITMMMFVVTLFQPAFLFWSMQQRLDYKYRLLVLVTVINSTLMPIIGIFLVSVCKMGYVGVILGYVLSNAGVGTVFYVKNLMKGRLFYSKEYWSYSLKFSLPLIPHYLSQMVLGQSDRVMIKYYCGASQAGIYSLAYQISLIMNLLISGINNSLSPWMYRCMKDRKYENIRKSTTQLIALVVLLSGIAMLIAPEIVGILGTEEYMSAIWIIPPVMLSTCITFCYCIWGTILFYFECTNRVSLATSSGVVLNLILNVIFIPHFGFVSAAYTTLFGYVVICLFYFFFTRKVCMEKEILMDELFNIKTTILMISFLTLISIFTLFAYQLGTVFRYFFLLLLLIYLIKERKQLALLIKSILIK